MINRNPLGKRKYMVAEINNGEVINFYDYQNILEIFDVDEIIIPDSGLYYGNSLWIYENFTDLDSLAQKTSFAWRVAGK